MIKKLLIAFMVLAASAAWAMDIPKLTGLVSDYANLLSADERTVLDSQLKTFTNTWPDNPQMMVLTVQKLPVEGIEQFSNEVFRAWGVGQKGKDNGILLVIAPNERKLRIEVGYGLEPIIPDSKADSIIQHMKPFLKSKDWAGAINLALNEVASSIPKPKAQAAPSKTIWVPSQIGTPAKVANINTTKPTKTNNDHTGLVLFLLAFFVCLGYFIWRIVRSERNITNSSSGGDQMIWEERYVPKSSYESRKNSYASRKNYRRTQDDRYSDGLTTGLILGSLSSHESDSRRRSRSDDDSWGSSSRSSSSESTSSWGSSSSSSDSSSWSGGGGDSGGGGASGDW